MAEGSGLLNRRTGNTVPGVQIPPSPPVLYLKSSKVSQGITLWSFFYAQTLLNLVAESRKRHGRFSWAEKLREEKWTRTQKRPTAL